MAYHIYEKKANYENRQHNFARINDIDEWFFAHDQSEHHDNTNS